MRNLIFMLFFAYLIGCAGGPHRHKAEDPVVLLNRDLRRTLWVDQHPKTGRDKSGRLIARTQIRNKTKEEILYLQIQNIWRDEFGLPLSQENPWSTATLTPGQSKWLNFTAPDRKAAKFTIRIRYFAPRASFKRSEIPR